MFEAICITAIATAVPSFLVGAIYGKAEEAKAISLWLRIKASTQAEFWTVVKEMRIAESSVIARIKKYL